MHTGDYICSTQREKASTWQLHVTMQQLYKNLKIEFGANIALHDRTVSLIKKIHITIEFAFVRNPTKDTSTAIFCHGIGRNLALSN